MNEMIVPIFLQSCFPLLNHGNYILFWLLYMLLNSVLAVDEVINMSSLAYIIVYYCFCLLP